MGETRNATTSSSGRRFYNWGKGERYWSVTTILGALPKDALKWWAARSVAEFAVERSATWMTMKHDEAVDWLRREPLRYTNERADFGGAVHNAAESYVLKRPIRGDWSEEERLAVGQFLDFVRTLSVRYLLVEAPVYNRTQKFAGTLDGIVVIPHALLVALAGGNADLVPWQPDADGNVTLLIDYKTGGEWAARKGVYPEVALQLAAYANSEFVGMPNGEEQPLPRIDGAAVVHIRPEGWRLVPVDALRPEVFRSFLYVREVFRWKQDIEGTVLGQALEPVRDEIPDEHRAPAQSSTDAAVDEVLEDAPAQHREIIERTRAKAPGSSSAPLQPGMTALERARASRGVTPPATPPARPRRRRID